MKKRVRGKLLMQLLCDKAVEFIDECTAACSNLPPDRLKQIKAGLNTNDNKASTEQRKQTINKMRKEVRRRKATTKGERKKGIDVPPEIGGAVKLQLIAIKHMNGKANAERILRAELTARGIVFSDVKWNKMEWKEKKLKLKEHECGQKAKQGQGKGGIEVSDVKAVKPVSDELIAFLRDRIETNGRLEALEDEHWR